MDRNTKKDSRETCPLLGTKTFWEIVDWYSEVIQREGGDINRYEEQSPRLSN